MAIAKPKTKPGTKYKAATIRGASAKSSKKTKPKTKTIPVKTTPTTLLQSLAHNVWFRRFYAPFSLLVLASTTVYWVALGAHLQNGNADQLSDPYLFSSSAIFHGATFPGTHTFLFKWPIFWLVNRFGISNSSLTIATVAAVLVTVLALALILRKIEPRPLVFGTICLFLSLALLLVPTQPYAGGLLPVNMAMLTTRNLEYILYIGALVLLVRAGRIRSWRFLSSVACLALLIASDKLFMSLGGAAAVLMLCVYAALRNWDLAHLAVRWLFATVAATIIATALLVGIQAAGITHFANDSTSSPYAITGDAKDIALGTTYAVASFFTNLGANPAYDATALHTLPAQAFHRLFSLAGPAYILAFGAALYGIYLLWGLLLPTFKGIQYKDEQPHVAFELSLLLFWSLIAAFGVFVGTKHYYAVDARYLAIGLFTIFIGGATVLRYRVIRSEFLILASTGACIAIVLAVFTAQGTYNNQSATLAGTNERNQIIAQALQQHKVTTLVGDYWRVLPTKFASHHNLQVLPLSGCTEPRQTLSSLAWQPNLHKTSFAYLLSLDGSLTDYPHCSFQQVVAAYGHPNASLVVAGTLANPKELVLFYDKGVQKNTTSVSQQTAIPATVLPIDLSGLTDANCTQPTTMTVVAHQDDDLLFTNPDLLHDIEAGNCVRTVFLTAGDSGYNKFYWLNRQLGSEAAYSNMLGINDVWVQRTVKLDTGEYITVASPRSNSKVSLIFFNLPDGDIHGGGFPSSHFESLAKLRDGKISTIHAVDGESSYTSSQLTSALSSLMNVYKPAEIHTQADVPSAQYPDHSDHIAAGNFTVTAAKEYDQVQFASDVSTPVKRYIGYPIHGYPANVSGADLQKKEAAFFAYSRFDGGVCHSAIECSNTATYNSYLARQYQEGQ